MIVCDAYSAPVGYVKGQCSGTFYGDSCINTCDVGYYGTATSVSCMSTGNWSFASGCYQNTSWCPTLNMDDGYTRVSTCSRHYNATCDLSCALGFDGVAKDLKCLGNHEWEPYEGCTRNLSFCPVVSVPAGYSSMSCDDRTFQAICVLECSIGYSGAASVLLCQSNAHWSTPSGCEINSCDYPTVAHGYVIDSTQCNGTTYQSSCTNVTCAVGYHDNGNNPGYVTCQSNSTWSAFIGCDINDCGPLPYYTGYSNASTVSATTYGAVCALNCALGYVGTPSSVTCLANSTWSTPTGCTIDSSFCQVINVPIGYEQIGCGSRKLGTICDLECSTGYSGDVEDMECLSDRTWSFVDRCFINETYCPVYNAPIGYVISNIVNGRRYLASISLNCDIGSSGNGGAVSCTAYGGWTQPYGCTGM